MADETQTQDVVETTSAPADSGKHEDLLKQIETMTGCKI